MKKNLIIAVAFMMMFAGTAVADNNSYNDTGVGVIGGQGQGQGQQIIDNSINEAADLNDGRAFANPGSVQYGPVLNYFGQPLPSSMP